MSGARGSWTSRALQALDFKRPPPVYDCPLLVAFRIAFDGRAFSSPAGGVRRYVGARHRDRARRSGDRAGRDRRERAQRAPAQRPARAGGLVGADQSGLGRHRTADDGAAHRIRRVSCAGLHGAALGGEADRRHHSRRVVCAAPRVVPARQRSAPSRVLSRIGARAARVITDSAFSRDEIVAAYQIAADRIDIVPLAASAMFSPDAATPREAVVLHAGDLHPRRNLILLLDVVIDLRRTEAACRDLRLVLAGVDRGSLADLERRARAAGASNALVYAGRPGDVELRAWYRRAGCVCLSLAVAKASVCPCSKRWPAGRRSWLRRRRPCPRWSDEPRRVWTRMMRAAGATRSRPSSRTGIEPARPRCEAWRGRRCSRWDRTARETLAVYARVRASR